MVPGVSSLKAVPLSIVSSFIVIYSGRDIPKPVILVLARNREFCFIITDCLLNIIFEKLFVAIIWSLRWCYLPSGSIFVYVLQALEDASNLSPRIKVFLATELTALSIIYIPLPGTQPVRVSYQSRNSLPRQLSPLKPPDVKFCYC